jgi:hypothetical protein
MTSTQRKSDTERKSDNARETRDSVDLAALELQPYSTGGEALPVAFGDTVWRRWVEEVRSNPAYHLRDPDNPNDRTGATSSAGGQPMPALIVEYGDGPHDYISTDFDAGQAIVRNGNDPTGRAWKFPEATWRRFVARVLGEELPEDEKAEGPTQHEEAALFAKRTAASVAADERANQAADKK